MSQKRMGASLTKAKAGRILISMNATAAPAAPVIWNGKDYSQPRPDRLCCIVAEREQIKEWGYLDMHYAPDAPVGLYLASCRVCGAGFRIPMAGFGCIAPVGSLD